MTRRSLLALLAAGAADPERLLWTPGKKLISIPAPTNFGAAIHFTIYDQILLAALDHMQRHVFVLAVDHVKQQALVVLERVPKIGDTLTVHAPPPSTHTSCSE